MWTSVFIVHRPYFQHLETKDHWTQDMAYEWKTFSHLFPLNHDPTIISTLNAYLLELNNVQPVPKKFIIHPLVHLTLLKSYHAPRHVLQDLVPVLMEFLFVNNGLTTLMFSPKTPKMIGKTSSLYCRHKKLSILSLNQVLRLLQLQHKEKKAQS